MSQAQEKDRMLQDAYAKEFANEDCPTPIMFIRVRVKMFPSDMFDELARAYHQEVVRVNKSRNPYIDGLTVLDLKKYFATLFTMRLGQVTTGVQPEYRNSYRSVAVPVLLYQILTSIGEVEDKKRGIILLPAGEVDGELLLSESELRRISDSLRMLENCGLRQVKGLPYATDGDFEFMAMAKVQNEIRYFSNDPHPVKAFLASFLDRKIEDECLFGSNRVLYGTTELYASRLTRLLLAIDGGEC